MIDEDDKRGTWLIAQISSLATDKAINEATLMGKFDDAAERAGAIHVGAATGFMITMGLVARAIQQRGGLLVLTGVGGLAEALVKALESMEEASTHEPPSGPPAPP